MWNSGVFLRSSGVVNRRRGSVLCLTHVVLNLFMVQSNLKAIKAFWRKMQPNVRKFSLSRAQVMGPTAGYWPKTNNLNKTGSEPNPELFWSGFLSPDLSPVEKLKHPEEELWTWESWRLFMETLLWTAGQGHLRTGGPKILQTSGSEHLRTGAEFSESLTGFGVPSFLSRLPS